MCGIVGALDLRGRRDLPPRTLERMAAALRRRGPDDGSMWSEPGVAMAIRRLALVDVARGRQPFHDAARRVYTTCNGELYNHDDLRRELPHDSTTRCDAELWPALYLAHGEQLWTRTRGQFAVAIYDRRERLLLLARDRVGICPLHWTVRGGWLLWASEIKALLASGLVDPEPDVAGIDAMFSLFAAGPRRTCFKDIHSLAPGHYLRVQGGQVREHRWWDLDFPDRGHEQRPALAPLLDETHATLTRAVTRRLAADVPVATYLSGGLDSALLLALANAATTPRTAFTVGFDAAGPDERPRTARAAAALGSPLDVLVPTPADLLAALPEVVEAAEGPIMDTADACLLLLARRVHARGFKAVLTGEGADESMAGYVWHRTHRVLAALHPAIPRALHAALARLLAPGTPAPNFADHFTSRPALLDVYEPLSRARWLLYADDMAARLRDHDPIADLGLDLARMRRWHPLHQSLYLEYKLMLPGHLLHGKGDRVAMRSALECRYPFLDEDFVDLAARLAPSFKQRRLTGKWLLRQLARRVLPAAIADPPKQMFKAHPLCSLAPHPAWIDQLLRPASLRATGWFSPARVAHERALQRRLPASAPRRFVVDGSFTALVTTQLWHHLYLGGDLCELPRWSPPPPEPLAVIA